MTLTDSLADGACPPRVVPVARCILQVSDAIWDYASINKSAIDAHWRQQKKANPNYFNGSIWLLQSWSFDKDSTFQGTFLQTDFRAYLYWRHQGFEPAGVWDAFGSGLVRSADGAILLGEQSSGNVNAGFSYPPSGFIDPSDVMDTQIDIGQHIAREVLEETGLAVSSSCHRQPGYLITFSGKQISIGVLFQSEDSTDRLHRRIAATLIGQDQSELAAAHWVRSMAEVARLSVPAYVEVLLSALFAGEGG